MNIPPTLLPIHPATVLSGYFIFKPIPNRFLPLNVAAAHQKLPRRLL